MIELRLKPREDRRLRAGHLWVYSNELDTPEGFRQLPVGSQCLVQTIEGEIEAEVVGFGDDITYLMPTEAVRGIVPGSRVMPLNRQSGLPVGMGLLGREIGREHV